MTYRKFHIASKVKWTIFLFLATSSFSIGQNLIDYDLIVLPKNPTKDDTIKIISQLATPSSAVTVSFQYKTNSDSIEILQCIQLGTLNMVDDLKDTATIFPPHNLGKTNVRHIIDLSWVPDSCWINKRILDTTTFFEVSNSTSLQIFDKTEINIYPNPIENGQQLIIKSNSYFDRIDIYSLLGVRVERVWFSPTNDAILSLPNLPTGTYTIKGYSNKKPVFENKFLSISR